MTRFRSPEELALDYTLDGYAVLGSAGAARIAVKRDVVLAALAVGGGSQTADELAETLDMSRSTVRARLGEIHAEK